MGNQRQAPSTKVPDNDFTEGRTDHRAVKELEATTQDLKNRVEKLEERLEVVEKAFNLLVGNFALTLGSEPPKREPPDKSWATREP